MQLLVSEEAESKEELPPPPEGAVADSQWEHLQWKIYSQAESQIMSRSKHIEPVYG